MKSFEPRRYFSPSSQSTTFLQRALETAPEFALNLLEAVNWSEPQMVLSTYSMPNSDQTRGSLRYVHPLCSVIHTGRLDLFKRALELARKSVDKPVYIDSTKEYSTPYDWVDCQVLNTAACRGSLDHLKALLEAMKACGYQGMTRLSKSNDRDVWFALSLYAKDSQPISHWKNILRLLDQKAREDTGMVATDETGKPPKWNQWERRMREHTHTTALEYAAENGNASMIEAILSLRHAKVTPQALANAWRSDSPDLALAMLRYDKKEWCSMDSKGKDFEGMCHALVRTTNAWHTCQKNTHTAFNFTDLDIQIQRQAARDGLEALLGWVAESKTKGALKESKGHDFDKLPTYLEPILIQLDVERFERVRPTLEAIEWALPRWEECEHLATSGATSPYQAFRLAQLQGMEGEQVSQFFEGLQQQLTSYWRLDEQTETIFQTCKWLFQTFQNFEGRPSPSAWLTVASEGFTRTLEDEQKASFMARLMDQKLPMIAPTKPKPRL